MEKYKEPQIYIVNNREITERLSQNYIVATGDLGVAKTVEYEEYVNKRYVDLEYSMISNLHEYSVIIIDLQNENDTRHCLEDSNLHASRHTHLKRARLPIPPPGHKSSSIHLKERKTRLELATLTLARLCSTN